MRKFVRNVGTIDEEHSVDRSALGDLVASFLAANDDEADRTATEAFLLGSRRATIENREVRVEAAGRARTILISADRQSAGRIGKKWRPGKIRT